MKELDPNAIEHFMRSQPLGHFGTIRQGRPYIVPVAYHYERQTVYFATEPSGKVDDVKGEGSACFEVDEYLPEIGEYRSVIGYGHPQIVQDPEERQRILRLLIGRFEKASGPFATSKDYPAHTMSEHEEPRALLVVALPLDEVSGREAA